MRNVLQIFSVIALSAALAACGTYSSGYGAGGYGSRANTGSVSGSGGGYDDYRCASCGTVADIRAVDGGSSGAGAIIGAVVGGLLGNQVGGGSGQDIATALGAVGGAVAGNEVERRRRGASYYEVIVNMDNGGREVVNIGDPRGLSVGMDVKIVGNDIQVLR